MQRPSVHPYTNTEVPGVNVWKLRNARDLSQRQLADMCDPPLDWSTISRLESGKSGWTSDTLGRIAKVLGVEVSALFVPPELAELYQISEPRRKMVYAVIRDAVAAQKADDAAKD